MKLPYLDTHLEIGFAGFHTILMRERLEALEFNYIAIRWHFFKWSGSFRLYRHEGR